MAAGAWCYDAVSRADFYELLSSIDFRGFDGAGLQDLLDGGFKLHPFFVGSSKRPAGIDAVLAIFDSIDGKLHVPGGLYLGHIVVPCGQHKYDMQDFVKILMTPSVFATEFPSVPGSDKTYAIFVRIQEKHFFPRPQISSGPEEGTPIVVGAFGTELNQRRFDLDDLTLRRLFDVSAEGSVLVPHGMDRGERTFKRYPTNSSRELGSSWKDHVGTVEFDVNTNLRMNMVSSGYELDLGSEEQWPMVNLEAVSNQHLHKIIDIIPGAAEESQRRADIVRKSGDHRPVSQGTVPKLCIQTKAGQTSSRVVHVVSKETVRQAIDEVTEEIRRERDRSPEAEVSDLMNRGFHEGSDVRTFVSRAETEEGPRLNRLESENSVGVQDAREGILGEHPNALTEARKEMMDHWGRVRAQLREVESFVFFRRGWLSLEFMACQGLGFTYMNEIERRLLNLTARFSSEANGMSALYFQSKANSIANCASVTAHREVVGAMHAVFEQTCGEVRAKVEELAREEDGLRELVSRPQGMVLSEESRWVLDRSEPRTHWYEGNWTIPNVDASIYRTPRERRGWTATLRDTGRSGASKEQFLRDMKDVESLCRGEFPHGLSFREGAARLAKAPRFEHDGAMGGGQRALGEEGAEVALNTPYDPELNPEQQDILHDVLSTTRRGIDPMETPGYKARIPPNQGQRKEAPRVATATLAVQTSPGWSPRPESEAPSTPKGGANTSGPAVPEQANTTPDNRRPIVEVPLESGDEILVSDTTSAVTVEDDTASGSSPVAGPSGELVVTARKGTTRRRAKSSGTPTSARTSGTSTAAKSPKVKSQVVVPPGSGAGRLPEAIDGEELQTAIRSITEDEDGGESEKEKPRAAKPGPSRSSSKRTADPSSTESTPAKKRTKQLSKAAAALAQATAAPVDESDEESYTEGKAAYVDSLQERVRNGGLDLSEASLGGYGIGQLRDLLKQTSRSMIEFLETDELAGKNFRLKGVLETWSFARGLVPAHIRDYQKDSPIHYRRPAKSEGCIDYGKVLLTGVNCEDRRHVFPLRENGRQFRQENPHLSEFIHRIVDGLHQKGCPVKATAIFLVAQQGDKNSFGRGGLYNTIFGDKALRRKNMFNPPSEAEKADELVALRELHAKSGDASEPPTMTTVYWRKEIVFCPMCPYMRFGDCPMSEHIFAAHMAYLPVCGGCQNFVFLPPVDVVHKNSRSGRFTSVPKIPGVDLTDQSAAFKDWATHYKNCPKAAKIRSGGTTRGFGMPEGTVAAEDATQG